MTRASLHFSESSNIFKNKFPIEVLALLVVKSSIALADRAEDTKG